MEKIRAEEAKMIIKQQENNNGSDSDLGLQNDASSKLINDDMNDDNNGISGPDDTVTDDEQKFLEDRFGKQ